MRLKLTYQCTNALSVWDEALYIIPWICKYLRKDGDFVSEFMKADRINIDSVYVDMSLVCLNQPEQ